MTDTTVGMTDLPAASPDAVTVAPYAVVRTVALPAPAPSPIAAEYRERVGRLVDLTVWCERAGPELCDALYELAGSAPSDTRRRVLVPLRRDVHNRRSPRPSLRAALADLPQRLPLLAEWLSAREEIDRIGEALDALTGPALESDRTALAALCRAEDLQRAVALTSEDLLRAVRRAAAQGAAPDSRARKSEATVLRYAMRAVTRTAPLSWFSHVGWGRWHQDADGPAPTRAEPSAVARVDRRTLEALVEAVLGRPELRAALDYRVVPGLRVDGSQVVFRRQPPGEGTSPTMPPEEQVTLPLTAPLRHVLAAVGAGDAVRASELAAGIGSRLAGPREDAERAAAAYVGALIEQGLLRPEYPIDPQSTDAVREATRWLVDVGFADLAAILADIGADTERYARLPAGSRSECLESDPLPLVAGVRAGRGRAGGPQGAAHGGHGGRDGAGPRRRPRPRRPAGHRETWAPFRAVRRVRGGPQDGAGQVRRAIRRRGELRLGHRVWAWWAGSTTTSRTSCSCWTASTTSSPTCCRSAGADRGRPRR